MAGFLSPNFIKLVIESQRNLSEESARALAQALKLSKLASDFFVTLVHFNQAVNGLERQKYLSEMMRHRQFREIRQIEADQFEFYRAWYVSAIRELVQLKDFVEDPHWIAEKLSPKITPQEASASLELLIRLGFIKRNKSGRLVQANPKLSTGHEIRSLMVKNFHREMLRLATDSMEAFAPAWREIGSVTMGVSADRIQELKEKIFQFRQEILEIFAEESQESDQVMQFNIQLFPLTDISKSKERAPS